MNEFTDAETENLKRWAAVTPDQMAAAFKAQIETPEGQIVMERALGPIMAPLLKEMEATFIRTFEESEGADAQKLAAKIVESMRPKFQALEQRIERIEAEMFRRVTR